MKKLNDKGLTLVELVIAIAMSTIVIGAAMVFLFNAERSYRITQYSLDLQMESQVIMEQLSNWVMDSNKIEIADGGNALVLYRIPTAKLKFPDEGAPAAPVVDTNITYTRTIIYWRSGKLYAVFDDSTDPSGYISEIQAGDSASYDVLNPSTTPSEENIIGEHVEFFNLYVPSGVDPNNINSIEIKLSLKEGNSSRNAQAHSYVVSDVFSLRNSVYKAATPTPAPTDAPDEP